MLFHTNFENPLIAKSQEKSLKKKQNAKAEAKPANKLNFIVRSILPQKPKKEEDPAPKQENEVRLFKEEKPQPTVEDNRRQRKREKRKKYKHNKKEKMKNLNQKEPTPAEKEFIKLVNYIQDNKGVVLDIPVAEYSQKLNLMNKLHNEFVDDPDVLEL